MTITKKTTNKHKHVTTVKHPVSKANAPQKVYDFDAIPDKDFMIFNIEGSTPNTKSQEVIKEINFDEIPGSNINFFRFHIKQTSYPYFRENASQTENLPQKVYDFDAILNKNFMNFDIEGSTPNTKIQKVTQKVDFNKIPGSNLNFGICSDQESYSMELQTLKQKEESPLLSEEEANYILEILSDATSEGITQEDLNYILEILSDATTEDGNTDHEDQNSMSSEEVDFEDLPTKQLLSKLCEEGNNNIKIAETLAARCKDANTGEEIQKEIIEFSNEHSKTPILIRLCNGHHANGKKAIEIITEAFNNTSNLYFTFEVLNFLDTKNNSNNYKFLKNLLDLTTDHEPLLDHHDINHIGIITKMEVAEQF
ncbi:MAG: hypothetical protein KA998_04190 [Rickettsiaceae bacterium]|nr:hypothetical protein [Rickettsiaceae bacterium]